MRLWHQIGTTLDRYGVFARNFVQVFVLVAVVLKVLLQQVAVSVRDSCKITAVS
jgi:hypothetical protein